MDGLDLREKDLTTLRDTLRRFPCVKEAWVYGSRAKGCARRASDVDLAIEAPDATSAEWDGLYAALEEAPIIYQLDIVRPERLANIKLRDKIYTEGVKIYPA
jgi:predicted nucleotidyltransferase